jgi:uncharacterized phage protein gp47/JayE
MAYLRPNFSTIYNQIISSIQTSGLPGAFNGFLRTSIFGAFTIAIGKALNGVYGYLDYISLQAVPYTATGVFLEAWAAMWNIFRQPAQAAIGTIQLQADSNGIPVAQGQTLTRNVDGFSYISVGNTTSQNNLLNVSFAASTVGSTGNAPPGTPLTLQNSINGINQAGNAITITGGVDVEIDTALRTRFLTRLADPPNGGSKSDYIDWALTVPGCTRAFVIGNLIQPGYVSVYVMFDVAEAAFNGFPQGNNGVAPGLALYGPVATGDQLAIANYIEPLRPVTAIPVILAPNPQPLNPVFEDLNPNTTAMQLAVNQAITDMLVQVGDPTCDPTGVSRPIVYVYPSELYTAVNSVEGLVDITIVSPSAKVLIGTGNLPVLGTPTFNS